MLRTKLRRYPPPKMRARKKKKTITPLRKPILARDPPQMIRWKALPTPQSILQFPYPVHRNYVWSPKTKNLFSVPPFAFSNMRKYSAVSFPTFLELNELSTHPYESLCMWLNRGYPAKAWQSEQFVAITVGIKT